METRQNDDTAARLKTVGHYQEPADAEPAPGRTGMRFSYQSGSRPLDGYTIKRGIGVGGFGEVYFALNDAGKEVALKRIQRNMDVELRGVRHCLNLKHVNLIALWDIRTNEFGESWVVMEYVPGPSLRDVLESSPDGLSPEEIKRWFTSTASGVAYLHEHGIVHRDLKPGNVFNDQHEQVIKIGDYGLSKFISCSRRSGQTETVGTFHYMAPEIGKGEYGKEIDIYALGIILFELLTGQVPFEGESTQEIIMKHLTMDPDVSVVPTEFREVIAKALRKDPQMRYRSVMELVADLPWPDIAGRAEDVIRHHAVGPLTVSRSNPHPTAEHPGLDSTSTTDSAAGVRHKLPQGILPARNLANQTDKISFGPVQSHAGRLPLDADSVSSPHEQPDPTGIQFVGQASAVDSNDRSTQTNERDQALRVSHVANSTAVTPSAKSDDEPLASAMRIGLKRVSLWWNNANLSAPVRIGVLAVGGLILVQNSTWLLPALFALAVFYAVYYTGRRFVLVWQNPGDLSLQTDRQQRQAFVQRVRAWLRSRPPSDQATELIGSLLVGAIGSVVFSLLALAIGGNLRSTTVEQWAVFTWQTLIAVTAVWAILVATKTWSARPPAGWVKPLVLCGVGLVVGLIAFFSASSFDIDLSRVAMEDVQTSQTSHLVWHGIPMFPAMLLSFAGLFALTRFSSQTDPLRRTRLSVMNVALCLVVAATLSHLLNVPLTVLCVLAIVVSVSVQLASPWIHPDLRWEVGRAGEK